jgi:hypothetical protein
VTAADERAATLRLLAEGGRLVTSRARIVAAAARARRGPRTYTLWPDARQPMISADVGYPPAAEWLRRTMVPTLRRLPDAATWMSLRARAALIGGDDGLAVRVAVERGLVQETPRVAMYSPSGQAVSKAICFLFHDGDTQPGIVVKAMAEPRFDWRLRTESGVLEAIRERIRHDSGVVSTLPPPPLFAGDADGEFLLAEAYDPLGPETGRGSRAAALEWLRRFQQASSSRVESWNQENEEEAVLAAHDAWRLAGTGKEDVIAERVRALLVPMRGMTLPRCAVHGDFWRGNVAARDGSVRVYDWEWAAADGMPLFDLWTYELAELRLLARAGGGQLESELGNALVRLQTELRRRELDDRLALATLAPVLGALSFRIRKRLAMPDEMERHSLAVMAAAERLLVSGRRLAT